MESTGHPDLVHISEETKSFLDGSYNIREAEQVDGHKTFFILGKKNTVNSPLEQRSMIENNQKNLQLELQSRKLRNLSTNDLPSIPPTSPTAAPLHQSKSLSPSPILNTRKRLASISETVSKLLSTSASTRNNSEKNKSLLDQRKGPNPKIVIGITDTPSSERQDKDNTNGTILEESLKEQTQTTKTNISNSNTRSNFNCDKFNEKPVPYIGSSGYQQIPLVTMSSTTPVVDKDANKIVSREGEEKGEGDDSSVNITDLRSYISQSRCDVSPFSRSGSGSHRSEMQRNHYNHHRSYSQQSNSLSPWYQTQPNEYSNLSPSRKDSGIRTNSRRSSIQHQPYYKNSLTAPNRVSGYFTSSQSSLCPGSDYPMDDMLMKHMPSPSTGSVPRNGEDTLKACVQHLRKQSDLQLIRCVRDNARSQRSYLVKPPIRKFSLSFESPVMEKIFRQKAHRYESDEETSKPTYTLATPKYNTFIDIFVLSVIFGMVALSLFLLSPSYTKEYKIWVCCFVTFSSMIFTVLFLCSKQICRRPKRSRHFNSIFGWASKFYPWNVFGSILISLPVASILINFALVDNKKFPSIQFYYGLLLFVCLIHFCNFIQLNCWTKNILALISGTLFMAIGYNHRQTSKIMNTGYHKEILRNFTLKHPENSEAHWFKNYEFELCLDLLLVLILVFLLNREFEIGYRLSFYGNEVANQDKVRVQNMKNQADLLLHNIIPKHVAEELKNTAKYSKNHQDVGIIFASIVNFNEMYDESYLGGKEYLRVLNELIGGKSEKLLLNFHKSHSTYNDSQTLMSSFCAMNSNALRKSRRLDPLTCVLVD